jgi:hypothetical protein
MLTLQPDADLVCSHAEFQFDGLNFGDDTNTANSDDFNLVQWTQAFRPVNENLRERFYYL